ncbi:hypothetical protein SAY87_003005 [Trapa incisa]|uniref:NADH kinase n=1 Tax=Trapa incisa TaxID=236973 RepID=A0AAN7KML7_9MYRT|nr:hypothetical protein SAY87_003005 [Trapa incisa]
MARRKLLLLLKPLDACSHSPSGGVSRLSNTQILRHLGSRYDVHRDAISFCENILQKKFVDWEAMLRDNLCHPIQNVDMVVTVGGDGTLLHASHFVDDSIPILGVNSDPTNVDEVEEYSNEFDATRSTGYLCAATINNFEQVLDDILEGRVVPSKLSRLSIRVNKELLPTYALNDILVAHPFPAEVSRFSFRTNKGSQPCSPLVNCRSSGLRVSTAAGSTAAMLSAGGFQMPILSHDLQYMVREPISPGAASNLMHGLINPDQTLDVLWSCSEGFIYIDGCHVRYPIKHGDAVQISTVAPVLRVYLPPHLSGQEVYSFSFKRDSVEKRWKLSNM